MKFCVLIMDGAAGWPLPEYGNKTCLELAETPNLDALAREGVVGLASMVPPGMEPSSAVACMSVLGYDPKVYYGGRSGIEARSMGLTWDDGQVVFRCNLVAVKDGRMWSYSAGHITTEESRRLIAALQAEMGSSGLSFYPGLAYRHLAIVTGHTETARAACTPPHDIPNQPIAECLPKGPGSEVLQGIMERSKVVLEDHPVNIARRARGEMPATQVWLFWPTGKMPQMPPFREMHKKDAAITSPVDLLQGLARMTGMSVLPIAGVTDGPGNDYAGQAAGALEALENKDLVIIHVESPDEAGHGGSVQEKVTAISRIDQEVVGRIRAWKHRPLRLLVTPDHPTPIKVQTHVAESVPFLAWGPGLEPNGARAYSEAEAKATGLLVDPGYGLLGRVIKGWR